MTTQPEALRLADALDGSFPESVASSSADELRRLHDLLGKSRALNRIRSERIKELEQALGMAVGALEQAHIVGGQKKCDEALATGRQTLGGAA